MAKTTRDIDVRVRLKDADKFKKGMQEVGGGLSNLNGWLDVTKGILGSQIITKGLNAIKEAFEHCTDLSIEYESALAGLQKTAGLSDTALKDMSSKIMDMSENIPKSSTEIAKLADEFAHLGLQKEAILPFTEIMIKLADTTDMSASEAGTALAQLSNVMGTSIDDYERLGSTILYLGMTSATTESNITEMGQQLSMVGALYGMSEADVLAYAAALSSIGVESAAGSTAIQKLGNSLELMVNSGNTEKLEGYANVAGMTADAFAKMWEENPAGAISEFVTGLGKINDNGGSAISVLNDLGIKEVRVQKTIAGLASAGDLLSRTLENGQKAWEENSTLAEATGVIYKTTAARMEMAQNAIDNAAIAMGNSLKEIKVDIKETEAEAAKFLRTLSGENDLGEQIESIDEKFSDTVEQIERTRYSAEMLIGKIEELGEIDALDEEGLVQFSSLMAALLELIPNVGEIYDEQTGTIKGGTEALRDMVKAQTELNETQADVSFGTEKLEAYNIGLQNYDELLKQLNLAEADYAAKENARKSYFDKNLQTDGWIAGLDDEYVRLEGDAQKAKGTMEALQKEEKKLREELKGYEGQVDATSAATENLNQKNAELGKESEKTEEVFKDRMNSLEAINDELREAVAAYEEYRETVSKKIEGTIGGLGEIKYSGDTDFETLQNNMADRLKFLTEYQENLKKAQEMGYDSTFLQQFTDGTVDSAEALAGLVQASDEQVQQMNTDYATMKTQAEELATALATSATGIDETVADVKTAVETLVTGTAVNLTENGKDAIQTLIDGMNSQIGALGAKISTVNKMMARLNRGYAGLGSGKTGGGPTLQTHAQGLGRVPYNDYPALLHEGEMVLTRAEAAAYRAEQFMRSGARAMMDMRGGTQNSYETRNSQTVNFGTIVVREEADVEKIAKKIAELNARNAYGRGVRRR